MNIINCTPHEINLPGRVIPSSGILPRASENRSDREPIDGIPVVAKTFGIIENLPDPVPDTIYVVSALAAQAAWANGRFDVYCPGDPVRDEAGKIIGCQALCCNPA